MIVVASFFCNLVVDGIIFSFGMIMSHLVVHFDESRSKVALVGSLLSGFYLLMGENMYNIHFTRYRSKRRGRFGSALSL